MHMVTAWAWLGARTRLFAVFGKDAPRTRPFLSVHIGRSEGPRKNDSKLYSLNIVFASIPLGPFLY
jgi:hypothetical protein